MQTFKSEVLWKLHCTEHLKNVKISDIIACSFCKEFNGSWDKILDHVLQYHKTQAERKIDIQSPNPTGFRELSRQFNVITFEDSFLSGNYPSELKDEDLR